MDVLITHCPPFGILDKSNKDKNGGSKALRAISLDRKPKYHIFGHIHEANGMQKIGDTMYLNVAKSPIRLMIWLYYFVINVFSIIRDLYLYSIVKGIFYHKHPKCAAAYIFEFMIASQYKISRKEHFVQLQPSIFSTRSSPSCFSIFVLSLY